MTTTRCDVSITEAHFRQSDPWRARNCPFVRALHEQFGGEWLVVPWGAFQLHQGAWEPIMTFPAEVTRWIEELEQLVLRYPTAWQEHCRPCTWTLERQRVAREREHAPVDGTVEEGG